MNKTKKWYQGNKGLVAGRCFREASLAGENNPKEKLVCCKGCGKDTTNYSMLCDRCSLKQE
jgi:predicted amidophosphoribosyltransferase